MTSSFRLQKRREEAKKYGLWKFGDFSQHFLRPFGNCPPGTTAIPIGHANGVKVCIREKQHDYNKEYCQMLEKYSKNCPAHFKYSVNLYNPLQKKPSQITNIYKYKYRRPPYFDYNLQADYIRSPAAFNSTGLSPCRTPPAQGHGPCEQTKFFQYGYDYLEKAPPPFDITRLQQPYKIWKSSKDFFDTGRPSAPPSVGKTPPAIV